MPTESEFETVVSEADVEAGVAPMAGVMSSSTSSQQVETSSSPSFFSRWFNFAGMQKALSCLLVLMSSTLILIRMILSNVVVHPSFYGNGQISCL